MTAEEGVPRDPFRFEALYEKLEKPIYNVIYRWVWDAEDAQDLVQEAFIRLWRMKSRIHWETVEPLLYRIAVNLAANHRRRKKIRRWISLESVSDAVAAGPADIGPYVEPESEAALMRAVESLPERFRRVIILSEFSSMTYEQIGRSLGIPPGTVGSRRNAALKMLRKSLELCRGKQYD